MDSYNLQSGLSNRLESDKSAPRAPALNRLTRQQENAVPTQEEDCTLRRHRARRRLASDVRIIHLSPANVFQHGQGINQNVP
jgi:hypothetical protein